MKKEALVNNGLEKIKARPFLKWAGGKSQLIGNLESNLPERIKRSRKIERYLEPFIGGGAFFFYLKSNYDIGKSFICDINRELIICYKVIQGNPDKLMEKLEELQNDYLKKSEDQRKICFYTIREAYNNQATNFDYETCNDEWITRASYLIFLNKTCFNGLFRLNGKGEFNVPFGKYKNPRIYDSDNILEVSKALKNTEILNMDFKETARFVKKDTLVYFDPPYRPINETSNFTSYSRDGFNDEDQKRLSVFYSKLNKIGGYLILSNSDPKNYNYQDYFLDELYKDYNIVRVKATRMINCDASKRGEINELIIKNY